MSLFERPSGKWPRPSKRFNVKWNGKFANRLANRSAL